MYIYYILFIITFVLCFMNFIKLDTNDIYSYIAFCLLIILFVAFRPFGIDNDSENYLSVFNSTEIMSYSEILFGTRDYGYMESGYMLLNKIVNDIGGSYGVVMFIMATITGLLNYSLIYKISPYPFSSLLFYFVYFLLYRDFTQIRYGLSCAIAFWAVYQFINKDYIKTGVLVFLSVMFHDTAYILLLVFPIIYFVKHKLIYLAMPFLCIVGVYVDLFPVFLQTGLGNEHMELYTDAEGGGSFSVALVGYCIMLIYIYIEKRISKEENTNIYFDYFYRIVGISVSLSLLFYKVSIFQRFSMLLFQFSIILLPILIQKYNLYSKNKYFSFGVLTIFNLFFLYYGIRMINIELIRPYF